MKKFTVLVMVTLLLVSMVLSTGCSSNNDPAPDETSSLTDQSTPEVSAPEITADAKLGPELPKAAPANPSKNTLNLSVPQPFGNFDPHNYAAAVDYMITRQIYETLLFRDDQSVFRPLLATDYTISDDGLTYTFTLRQNVKFSNGDTMTAEDVLFSFERAKTAPIVAPNVAPIESVSKINDYTVQFKLTNQSAPFLGDIAAISIVNAKQCQATGEKFGEQPMGTGPYILDSHTKNVSLSLKANPNYWWGPASIEKVNYKVIVDPSAAYIAFQAGELDQVTVPTANWNDAVASGKWTTAKIGSTAVSYVQYNNQVKPFDSKLVRQAINYAINREDMLIIAMDGLAEPASVMFNPKYIFGATNDSTQYTYDPVKAKELLKEAGYPNGFDAGAILTVAGYFEKMASVLQQNLADIGIQAKIETREFSSYLGDVMKGNYTISVLNVALDPDMNAYSVMLHTDSINNLNMARYSNGQVDNLFVQGKATADSAKRKEIYKQLIQIVQDDAAYAPCFYPVVPIAYNKQLNFKQYTSSTRLYECYWKQ